MLKNLLGLGKKKSSTPVSKIPVFCPSPAIRDAIYNTVGSKSIPAMVGAAQKAFALASNPKAEARDFIDVISSDEALAARIIKIANSVFFDRGKKSSSIEDAVLVIGLNEIRNLLNANALSDIFPSAHPSRAQLWAHDIAVAIIARLLAQKVLPSKTDNAFLAGLMHDVGKLLLLQRSTSAYEKVLKEVEETGVDFYIAEANQFPFDHCQVGYIIGERWNFSSDLNEVISSHHITTSNQDSSPTNLRDIIYAADIIAHSLGLGMSNKFTRLRNNMQERTATIWPKFNISPGDCSAFLEQAKRAFKTEYDLYSGSFGR